MRDLQNAAPGLSQSVQRVALFMTLVGLTALLVGGVGIANAVRAFLDEKRATIATLKCLGAPAFLIFQTYLAQVLALAALGILAGLALGAAVPLAAAPLLEARLGLRLRRRALRRAADRGGGLRRADHPRLLALAAGARAADPPPAACSATWCSGPAPCRRPGPWAALAAAAAALAALAILGAEERRFAAGFVARRGGPR